MPQMMQSEEKNSPPAKSSGRISTWWRKFHFSGRVIIGSVLLGFGLVLVGGIVFAINIDDVTPKSEDQNNPYEIPTKPPSNVVGPVVMGIGSFIVIVGIVMCLFETQVCRKKKSDSSPLISERVSHENDSDSVQPTSHSHSGHRHGARKAGAHGKRSKGHRVKSRSKDRTEQKTPSPRSPAIAINATKSFMTSSEDKFLTPPNTLSAHTTLVHSTSRDAENQTSSSLMKSFTSSGPSWNQSSEFQTPSTSFRDTSVSLESSVEIGEDKNPKHIDTSGIHKLNMDAGFLTPVNLEEEKLQKIANEVKNQVEKLSNAQSTKEMGSHLNKSSNDEIPIISIPSECETDLEKVEKKSVLETKDIDEHQNGEGVISSNEQPLLKISKNTSFIKESQETTINSEKISSVTTNEEAMLTKILSTSEDQHITPENKFTVKSNSTEEVPNDVIELSKDESGNSTREVNKNIYKVETDEEDEQVDLESSVSSDETLVSQNILFKKHADSVVPEDDDLESQKQLEETVNLNQSESKSSISSALNDGIDDHKSQSSMSESEKEPPQSIDSQSKDLEMDERSEKFSAVNSS